MKNKSSVNLKKENQLPVHAIRESELADKSFKLPKIPVKKESNPIQLSMAEIADDSPIDLEHIIETITEPGETESKQSTEEIVLNLSNLSNAFETFADKQKVSIISLIKLMIPEIDNKLIKVYMTKQQEALIGELKIEWQAFLKNYFKDPLINLQFFIDEKANTKRKAYTPDEQFIEMLEHNALFKKMENQFKLKLKQ